MNRLAGKVALITGGNTGIGRAVALAFADEGADLAVGWLARAHEAESLAEAISARGRRCHLVKADVTREDDVQSMMAEVRKTLGPLDVLVNNAGIQKPQPITDMSVTDWDLMMAVHLRGTFLCSREAARQMMPQGSGRIINVCSQLGYIGRERYTAYSTAKGGVIAFTRALARELAPHGILVNGVAPGLVDTGFDPLPETVKAAHAASLPLSRLGTPEDMTSAFVFLASEEGRYYCGQLLHPNGGEIMP
ncbi:MAG TPA: 3-oxoacyl-ACP reductase family protein [Candidatus Methylomirabilis sp.]|nr:3-oxoacyl-ACP reductase family protein [Candidatus Methylomirabilis sp.]